MLDVTRILKFYFILSKNKKRNYYLLLLLYLLLALSGLTNSPRILHITEKNSFNLNCIHRDR